MTYLPIVEREMRVRARRFSLYWWRLAPAAAAMWLCLPNYFSSVATANAQMAGYQSFLYLAWLMQWLALCAGLPASHCLAAERREGTLGLLFLSGLKGFDIVLGKAAAFGLSVFMALLGMIPVLAVSLLAGGITAGEIARTALAILQTLLFSSAIGLWAAAQYANTLAIWKHTVQWLFFLALMPLLFHLATPEFIPFLAFSPMSAFLLAAETSYLRAPSVFWFSLGFVLIESLVFLWLAHRAVRATWQDQPLRAAKSKRMLSGKGMLPKGWRRLWEGALVLPGHRSMRTCSTQGLPASAPLRDQSPIGWLVQRVPRLKCMIWLAVSLAAGSSSLYYFWAYFGYRWLPPAFMSVTFQFLEIGYQVVIAWAACRFLSESRRNGEFELLVVTPVGARELLSQHWRALKIMLWKPVLLIILADIFFRLLLPMLHWRHYGLAELLVLFLRVAMLIAIKIFSLWTLCWVGMWLACRTRQLFAAVAGAIALVIFLPGVVQISLNVFYFKVFRTIQIGAPRITSGLNWMMLVWSLLPALLSLAVLLGILFWAQRGLRAFLPNEIALTGDNWWFNRWRHRLARVLWWIRTWQAD